MSSNSLAPYNLHTVEALKAKHPPPPLDSSMPPPHTVNDCVPLEVSVPEVRAAIKSFRRGSARGLDGLRPQHLLDLTSGAAGNNGY